MSNTIRRHILGIFVAVMAMSAVFSAITVESHAATVSENVRGTSIIKYLGAGSDGKTWKNPHDPAYTQCMYTVKVGGEEKHGYCFQSGKQYSSRHSYIAKRPANASAWTNLSYSRQRIVRLALYYGYNNGKAAPVSGANVNDYYAATQALIWEAADGDLTLSTDGRWSKSTNKHDDLIAGRTGATACYNWMKSQISRHVKGPSYGSVSAGSAPVHVMKYDYRTGKWSIKLPDNNKGNGYNRVSGTTDSLSVSRNGYDYTFSTTAAGNKTAVMMNSKSSGTGQRMMVFRPSNSGKQAILIGAEDTTFFYAKFRTERAGTGSIVKTTSDGSSPGGFRFLVENTANGYSRIHTTDESGKINLQLYPGTYKVTEILTEEQKEKGFVTPAGGQLKITEGGSTTLKLENIRKEIPFQIVKTSDNDIVEGFQFVISDASGKDIFCEKTSASGVIEGKLYPGKYTIREELTEEQVAAGYRGVKPQQLKITSNQSVVQIVKAHNLWDPIEGKIAVRKTTDDGGAEGGFTFNIEGQLSETGEKYSKAGCVTDKTGQYLSEEIEPGTYTITEVLSEKQKERYKTPAAQTVEITEKGQGAIVNFENQAIRTEVVLQKKSDDEKVAGVPFKITGTLLWGDKFEEVVKATDENGQMKIALQPGTYTFTETGETVEGYKKQPPKEVVVTGKETKPIQLEFINIPNSITLKKTEMMENGMKTDTPVAGAIYEIYRVDEYNGEEIHIDHGKYTTDDAGEFIVKGVVPGVYKFKETFAPVGYKVNEEPLEVVFTEDDVGIKVNDTNQRAKGSITVIVKDNQGNPVEAEEIGIYPDSGCKNPVETRVTDETGRFKVEDLPWGDYYIKEIDSPRGYEENNEIKKITIGKDGVIEAEYEMLKEQKRGRVQIIKTDETETIYLKGAEFSLYKTDGSLVSQQLETDEDGSLLIEGLEWGSYYLRETKAPTGYGVDTTPVSFSVNATTGGRLQKLNVINEVEASNIIIHKRIKAEDIHYDHGVPTFSFKLVGVTVDGEKKEYNRQISFSKKYVAENLSSEGYVTASVIFDGLKAGEYTCTEKDTLRYQLADIAGVSTNGTLDADGCSVSFTLQGNDYGQATFVNKKIDWKDYSDSSAVTNIIKSEKKLTAIAVEYLGPDVLDGNMPFDSEEYLDVFAVYDDGTERALGKDEYIVLNGDGSIFDRTSREAGEYTATVYYTEGGILRTETFSFTVKGAEQITVTFETNGGSVLEPLMVWKYEALSDYDHWKYTTEKKGYEFTGWYTNNDLSNGFTETDLIKENITLFAGWEQKHLDDYTWDELKEISESGEARMYLGECFDTIQADLTDDGQISAENFEHTKAFDCDGAVRHAMIAGFDHDVRTDGTTAGITMLVYEPLEAKAMIAKNTGRTLGWDTSQMRNTTLSNIYEGLPQAMKESISKVKKSDAAKTGNTISIKTTEDFLWLPSQTELYGAWGYDTWSPKAASTALSNKDYGALMSVYSNGNQYELFRAGVPDGVILSEIMLSAGSGYWTRSVDPTMDRAFCYVDAAGAAGSK